MNKLLLTAVLILSLVHGLSAPATSAAERLDLVLRVDQHATAEDVTYIQEGLRLAEEYLRETLDTPLDGRIRINVQATGSSDSLELVGLTTPGEITYFTGSYGWHFSSPTYRTEVVIHEFIHIYQGLRLGWVNWDMPAWMAEGMAEYLASDALIERGLLSRVDAETMRYWMIAGVPLDDLEEYESNRRFVTDGASVYGLAYLGITRLLDEGDRDVAQLGAFMNLLAAGARWEDAFNGAFGLTPDRFYRSFEQARRDFIAPSVPPPVYDLVFPVESASPVEITGLMDGVTAGEQFLMRARSEPNARCIVYLWGPSLDLVHETTADAGSGLFWLVTIPGTTPPQTAELSVDCGGGPIIAPVEIRARSRADDHRD